MYAYIQTQNPGLTVKVFSSPNKMVGGLCRSIFVGNGCNRSGSKGVYPRNAAVSWILNFLGSKENGSG
jgi:hypothetical protein